MKLLFPAVLLLAACSVERPGQAAEREAITQCRQAQSTAKTADELSQRRTECDRMQEAYSAKWNR